MRSSTPSPDMGSVPTDPLKQRYENFRTLYLSRGIGKAEAERAAATIACMNRRERRRFLSERGPKRGLPRLMEIPKSRQ